MNPTPNTNDEDSFMEKFNAMTKQRNAAQEAQDRAKAGEEIATEIDIRAVRKRRCVLHLVLCTVCMVALRCLYVTEHISPFLFVCSADVYLVCIGWNLNEAKRAFRRKG